MVLTIVALSSYTIEQGVLFKHGKTIANEAFYSMNSDTGEDNVSVFNDKTENIFVRIQCNSSDYKINYKHIEGDLQL